MIPIDYGSSFSSYLRTVSALPYLTEAEETSYALKWIQKGDIESAQKLITSHLRMVVKVARSFSYHGMPLQDLVSEGNIGLFQALRKFQPTHGVRFSTYARWWVRAQIQDYILSSWSLVKLSSGKAQKKLFFSLRSLQRKLSEQNEGFYLSSDSVQNISQTLGVSVPEVLQMESRFISKDASLNTTIDTEENGIIELQDTLPDTRPNQEVILANKDERTNTMFLIQEALNILEDRERNIIVQRCLTDPKVALKDVAKTYNISLERARQIEKSALKKMEKHLRFIENQPPKRLGLPAPQENQSAQKRTKKKVKPKSS